MAELKVRNLMRHNAIDFSFAELLEQIVGDHDGVVFEREGVDHARSLHRQQIDLPEFNAGWFGKLKNAIAQFASRDGMGRPVSKPL